MSDHSWVGKSVELSIKNVERPLRGQLLQWGTDLLVLYQSSTSRFYYVPLVGVIQLRLTQELDEAALLNIEQPLVTAGEQATYRKALMGARGKYAELKISENQSLYGYLSGIMNDYFVFCSPTYPIILIPLVHLKYMSPIPADRVPYNLTLEQFPLRPVSIGMARTFSQQLLKWSGEFVKLEIDEGTISFGLLAQVDNQQITLQDAYGQPVIISIHSIRSVSIY